MSAGPSQGGPLGLSERPDESVRSAPWIGHLVTLGIRTSKYKDEQDGRQLVLAISVPRRDLAAALFSCGWVAACPPPEQVQPSSVLRALRPETPIRVVTQNKVVTGQFSELDETKTPARVKFTSGSGWLVDRLRAVAELSDLEEQRESNRPNPGSFARLTRIDANWDMRLAAPSRDLAIVGTRKWLREDFGVFLGCEGDEIAPDMIANLLLPDTENTAVTCVRVYSTAGFDSFLPISSDIRGVVLDGGAAVKYIGEIESSVVLCILDRSKLDETAAEVVVQLRNSRGRPMSLERDLGWRSPGGIESLAFSVAL